MFTPEIPDRAGRGAICARIHALTKDIQLAQRGGARENPRELQRLLSRLDKERSALHKLYGKETR